jgi:nickel-dependent lactate racemase
MKIEIPYHKEIIEIDFPDKNIIDVIKTKSQKLRKNEQEIILEALFNPISSKRLSELAKEKKKAVILVSDITRPCPSYKFLPFIIDELNKAGVQENQIIFGLGSHRKHTDEEKRKLAGDYAFGKAELMDFDPARCQLLGHTKMGTPVEIFDDFLRADFVVATGNLEYHYFAGYSGGAKAAVPGICSRNTIQTNHKLMLHDKAAAGKFKDNPVRQDIEEAGKMVGINFIFNVILDDDKRIISAFSGKNNDAFIEGIKKYDKIFKTEIDELADIVIVSPGGHPKDMNLYQAQKALDNVKGIVKTKGEIILVASCEEGFGEKTFQEWMSHVKDFNKLEQRLRQKFVLGGHKAFALSRLLRKTRVSLYSNFDRKPTEKMGFKKINNLQKYIHKKIEANPKVRMTIVPNGRFVQFKG